MARRFGGFSLLSIMMAAVLACGQPSQPEPSTPGPKPAPPTASPTAKMDTKPVIPAAKPDRTEAGSVQLAINGSFEEWIGSNHVVGWKVLSGSVRKSITATDGAFALQLNPPAPGVTKSTQIQYSFKIPSTEKGSTLHFSMDGKAGSSKLYYAVYSNSKSGKGLIHLMQDPTGKKTNVRYLGKGDYTNMEIAVPLPDDADRDTLRLIIYLRPGATKPAMVDNVQVFLTE